MSSIVKTIELENTGEICDCVYRNLDDGWYLVAVDTRHRGPYSSVGTSWECQDDYSDAEYIGPKIVKPDAVLCSVEYTDDWEAAMQEISAIWEGIYA